MQFNMIINGNKVDAEDHFNVYNPATEEIIAQCPAATEENLNAAVTAAREAFPAWSKTSDDQRKEKVNALADIISDNMNELAQLITQEQGRPLNGIGFGSFAEVGGSEYWTRCTAELTLPIEIAEETDTHRAEIHRKPLGVVGSITPWNFPLLIAIWHVIPAIRSGNTVVLKPSSFTPLVALRFVELAQEVLPPGVLNIITGEGGMGRLITSHPDIDKIVFTGSTATGKNIMKNASDSLKRLTLELGGNDAAIILPDIDVKENASAIFEAAFINNGQTCAALKRLYVHEDIYEEMCEELTIIANTVTVANGMEEGAQLGPIQNRAQFELVRELVDDAKSSGARILTGGDAPEGIGYFYPVTLVADISDGTRLVDEEPFGPVLPIIKYSDVEDALQRANDNPNGLGGSVWSGNPAQALELAKRLECGTAWINNHASLSPNVPFGGVKQSGVGVEFSTHGLKEFTSIQSIVIPK
ncbi:MAG: aldehyde dehydrogenase family protein [Planktomarina sp.]|nr:aldehyde dehydrogenase family protein [Planktomarina sp.]